MVRIGLASKKSSPSREYASKFSKMSTNCVGKSHNLRYRRNPFLLFLTYFRKTQKMHDCNMTAIQSSVAAGALWNRMSPTARKPFIDQARKFNYTFKSRDQKVNWVLAKLRNLMANGQLQLHCLRLLATKMASWNECVLAKCFTRDEEMGEDRDDD